jgi:uncharacterized protein UPF0102
MAPRTQSRQQLGVRGEELACAELERQGMRVLARNWRCRLGEIDIVAVETGEKGVTLVFCEVKCRSGLGFGHPLEAITGFTRIIVPLRQAGEAKLVTGIDVFGIASITQLVAFLRDEPMPVVDPIEVLGDTAGKHAQRRLDLADVVGQVEAKWACEVALPAGITCSSMARLESAKPCSPSVSRGYFPISMYATPSRYPLCTPWLGSTLPTS